MWLRGGWGREREKKSLDFCSSDFLQFQTQTQKVKVEQSEIFHNLAVFVFHHQQFWLRAEEDFWQVPVFLFLFLFLFFVSLSVFLFLLLKICKVSNCLTHFTSFAFSGYQKLQFQFKNEQYSFFVNREHQNSNIWLLFEYVYWTWL